MLKSLPVSPPSIKTFQYHAFQFAVSENYESSKSYILSNFIQLFCNTSVVEGCEVFHLDFYPCFQDYFFYHPNLITQTYSRSFLISLKASITDIILNALESDKYIILFCDRYFILNDSCYQKYHMLHDYLISGIDMEKQTVIISHYDNNQTYGTYVIELKQIENAFYSTTFYDNLYDYDYYDRIIMFKFDDHHVYEFDVNLIHTSLYEYLNSINSEQNLRIYKNPNTSKIFGISVYSNLKIYIDKIVKNKQIMDIRPFYLLKEHKELMSKRIEYLESHKYLSTSYFDKYKNHVELKMDLIVKMIIKYNINKDIGVIERVLKIIENVEQNEKDILEKKYSDLLVYC